MYSGKQDALADLIGSIYDAALDDSLWAGLSNNIAGFFGATSTVVKIHGPQERVSLLDVTPNLLLSEDQQDWAGYWHERDLWVKRLRHYGMNRIFTDDELVLSEEERYRDPFYQEWLRHLDIYHVIGAAFPVEGNAVGILGVHSPEDASRFTEQDSRQFAQMLPHVQRAVNLGERMAQATLIKELCVESLDAVDTGMMILDVGGIVRHCNRIADRMLAGSHELLVRGDRLTARSPALRSQLETALSVALTLANGQFREVPAPLRIDRPDRLPWTMAIMPLRPKWSKLVWQRPLALVLMRDPEYPPYAIDLLRSLFGLTAMEARVAALLAHGTSPEQMPHMLSIGIGTVRTHLKQILAKTGTRRQGETIALIGRSIASMGNASSGETAEDRT